MTPNFAFGGNCALEGVAALANALNKALKNSSDGRLSQSAISAMFEEYQESQKPRVKKIFNMCYYVTRMQAWDGVIMRFIARYVVPWLGDELVADHTSTIVKGGVKLDYLPVPERPRGTCAWDDEIHPKKSPVLDRPGPSGWAGLGYVEHWKSKRIDDNDRGLLRVLKLSTQGSFSRIYLFLLAGVFMSACIRYTPQLVTGITS